MRSTLSTLGYRNVQVRAGNGYVGWPEHAPYDRVMVTAAPDAIPPALVEQLKIGGLMPFQLEITLRQDCTAATTPGVEPSALEVEHATQLA